MADRVEAISYRSVGDYDTKDSGERAEFASGMVRDVQTGKPRYDLIPLAPLKRVAELYARGAEKYGERNWEKANGVEELERFKASAFRHLAQALAGEEDEDHWAAVVFNAFGAMFLKAKLDQQAFEALPATTPETPQERAEAKIRAVQEKYGCVDPTSCAWHSDLV